jgi:6-phosphogluconolactonase
MKRPDLQIFPDPESAARAGAESFARAAREAERERGRFAAVLSGGDTPRRMYELLAEAPLVSAVPWEAVHLFWGDERSVPPEHPRSNYGMAARAFIDKVGIPSANVHRMRGELEAEAAAAAYVRELEAFFVDAAPRFDLVHLGVGTDGHTASLFPHATEVLFEPHRAVCAAWDASAAEARVTLTARTLSRGRQVELLEVDGRKAAVLAAVYRRERAPAELPLLLIEPEGEWRWLLTALSASALGPQPEASESP